MKDHERIFFALCFNAYYDARLCPYNVVDWLGDTIPHKRCWYYLRKWSDLGFYDYGVALDFGWFYPDKLPERYREIIKEAKQ